MLNGVRDQGSAKLSTGTVTIPGLAKINMQVRLATTAYAATPPDMFGNCVMIAARPTTAVMRASPVAALRKTIKQHVAGSQHARHLAESSRRVFWADYDRSVHSESETTETADFGCGWTDRRSRNSRRQ